MSQIEKMPKLDPAKRLETIKRELLRGSTHQAVADMCGVSRKTIERDIRAWELSGGYDEWARRMFREQYDELRKPEPVVTFKEISKHAQRTMTQRTEARVEGFTLRIWQPGDKDEDEPEPKDL